ncbi:MAG TPA: diacylglycerol kinase family protein [Acidimicrobiales bacterium]|nr:diacylglycerol kinase family protein [Acidimicrobiales bacterium]
MRVLLLVNASASSVTPRTRVVIAKALSADHDVEVAETSRRGHATRIAQGAAAEGYGCVVVLGGDGTLNEAANGLAGTDTALGVLPGGSTNVFARTIGMVNQPIEATGQLLVGLARGSIARVGLGSVNGRYFLFHVGMGFDAAVVEQVERRAGLKRYAGHPLFVYAAFATWFRHFDRARPRFSVSAAGHPVVDDGYLAICLNTNPYTFLGNRPLDIAPDAGLDRSLVMVTARTMSFVPMLTIAASALNIGRPISRHRRIAYQPGVVDAVVDGHGPFPYQVDGDFLGETERLEFRHEPDVLNLVLPEPMVPPADT